ncbi:hypothetical protein GCM10009836_65550 [Pseudonocardia ailaonensis]|uniref:Antibiotic biosynthesis monooxygenase n=1 Tax=Pseudonocardia ailaonensis TaxID=367279 RepID=A0ABN2NM87_9PSEU
MNTAPLTLTAGPEVVAVVERLELGEPAPAAPGPTAPQPPHAVPYRAPEQVRVLPDVIEHVRGLRSVPGFRGAIVLAGRDHNRISVYSRFDAGTGSADRPVLDTVTARGVPARTLDTRAYELVWQDGEEPPALVSIAHTPLVHFGLFTVLDGRTDALLDKVAASAPASLVTPGLRTVNFHRSLDGERLVNVGTWSTFDHFATLLRQPGFTSAEKYWAGLATFENDYFDVVEVVEDPTAGSPARTPLTADAG